MAELDKRSGPKKLAQLILQKLDAVEIELDTIIDEVTAGTSINANTDFFTIDLSFTGEIDTTDRAALLRIDVCLSVKAKLLVTFDSTNYLFLLDDNKLKADTLYSFEFGVENLDTFNIQSDKTTTVRRCICSLVARGI